MLESDISYSYDTRGYMMYYKGNPLGGAGIDKYAKGCRSNLKLFRESADFTKRSLLQGHEPLMQKRIAEIDAETED